MKIGNKVVFTGCTEAQHKWGNNTNPDGILTIGQIYTVKDVEEHTWHTKILLEGIEGKFNSVCFEGANQ